MNKHEIENLIHQCNETVAGILKVPKRKVAATGDWPATSAHGLTVYHPMYCEVKISKYLVNDNDILETIYHELCHVYAPRGAGHGPAWKRVAAAVQAGLKTNLHIARTNRRQHSNKTEQTLLCQITCPHCGKVVDIYSRRSGMYQYAKWHGMQPGETSKLTGYYCNSCGKEATSNKLQITLIRR